MTGKPGRPRKNREPVNFVTESTPVPTPGPQSKQDAVDPLDLSIGVKGEKWVALPPVLEPHPMDRETSSQARTETRYGFGRSERKPLGVPEQRLQATIPKGMTGRWINDTPGRIQRAQEAGYEFISSNGGVVQTRDGGRSEIVGTGREGGAMKGYLMAIPTVLYKQDQAAKASKIQDMEDSIVRGDPQQAAEQDTGRYYVPSEGINLRHTRVDR